MAGAHIQSKWVQHGPPRCIYKYTSNILIAKDVETVVYNHCMSWYVYMIRCENQSLYTGVTTDVDRRFKEHAGDKAGAKYTRANKPVAVVYTRRFRNRSNAQKEEWRMKRLSKTKKEALICSLS